ncbi:restriction endonuclease subunit S [Vibrio sp. F13]|uniref:restriction endonuclease subunit S n=1 Tax=Vibrio sp. F13 TaxID=2070777 RepID=UPI0010BD2C5D|nr:restriction endonuclease subunit S [Vibrio sp. F13]TKG08585.1 restriction endonuclease subunit S [Vibrio sp. F13]
MTGRYKAYPEYKSTDEVWLGDVPSHWRDLKINRLTIVKRGASPRPIDDPKYFDESGEYAWVRIADVTASDTYLANTTQRLSPLGASLSVKLEPNELFLSIAGTVGKPCINKIKACIHDGFVYFPEYKENTKFLFYIFAAGEAYKGLGKFGTQLNLNTETVGGIKIGIPCIEEQHKIVNFLDHETAKIDTLIAKQEKLIELLKEKRQAVISHAVTKGLNPDAPMKDSGVEWLGEVPEHWSLAKLGLHARKIGSGKTPRGGADVYQDSGVLFLRSQNIYDEGLRISGKEATYISDEIHLEMQNTKVKPQDILLNITGGSIGRTCIVPRDIGEANVNQHVCILRFSTNLAPYLANVMKSSSIKEQIDVVQVGGNREGLNFEQISNMKFCLPPKDEIGKINNFIEVHSEKYQTLVTKANAAIELIKERKSALISAAVTGKIDVRDWAVLDKDQG